VIVAPSDRVGDALTEARAVAGERHDLVTVVAGGLSRQESVAAGLRAVWPDVERVLVHDAARALTPPEVFARVIDALTDGKDAVLPVLPVVDTVKRVSGDRVREPIDRSELAAAQTPQGFRRTILDAAYAAASAEHTDDAALVQSMGTPVWTVPGDERSFKITTPGDLDRARALLAVAPVRRTAPVPRVGVGTDVHAVGGSGDLWLAGLHWPGEPSLHGHSDGDAVAHAIVDAVLAAAGLGDIGTHFGTDQPQYAGAHAEAFLARTRELVEAAGFSIGNVSVQVQARRPRFAARRAEAEHALSRRSVRPSPYRRPRPMGSAIRERATASPPSPSRSSTCVSPHARAAVASRARVGWCGDGPALRHPGAGVARLRAAGSGERHDVRVRSDGAVRSRHPSSARGARVRPAASLAHPALRTRDVRAQRHRHRRQGAAERHADEPWWALAYRVEREFAYAYAAIGILAPTYEPRATGSIPQMQELIATLIERGHAYAAAGDVYFDVRSWSAYGELTHQSIDAMEPRPTRTRAASATRGLRALEGREERRAGGRRVGESLGAGQAGLAHRVLGHEPPLPRRLLRHPRRRHRPALPAPRERAGAVAAAGDAFARYWVHNGLVTVGDQKMSKSLGNHLLALDVLADRDPLVVRYALGAAHYRSTLDLTAASFDEAEAALERIRTFQSAPRACSARRAAGGRRYPRGVRRRDGRRPRRAAGARGRPRDRARRKRGAGCGRSGCRGPRARRSGRMTGVLGMNPADPQWRPEAGAAEARALDALLQAMITQRAQARANKDWAAADRLRDAIAAAGVVLEDGPDGTHWSLNDG
jgi:2-C-methyl-D-erythritol 4-phosphate cytidylyltransferase/2-C-methyl-D-erythritol 2,4-cyclodiphosphate synthase